jgi:hypothetical protein
VTASTMTRSATSHETVAMARRTTAKFINSSLFEKANFS